MVLCGVVPRKNDHMHELINARLSDRTMTSIEANVDAVWHWLERKLSLPLFSHVRIRMYVRTCTYRNKVVWRE